MAYQDPKLVKSPKGAITHLRILWDGGEQVSTSSDWGGWSIAELEWYEERTMACRWNGSTTNNDVSEIGIPKPLQEAIRARLKDAPDPDREHALTRRAAEASAPAFAAVWDNPEDDVYDAL
jgi:hypothetical protein